jgi:hypothetical protein
MSHTSALRRVSAFAAIGVLTIGSMLLQAAPGSASETGIITGKVVDGASAGVADADVTLESPTGRYKTHTNGRGEFAIVGVLSDTYTLIVSVGGTVESIEPDIYVAGNSQFTEITATTAQS